MKKFVSYEKLSKKKQREINESRRGSWGGVNPVTRKTENRKAYNRRRAQDWKREIPKNPASFIFGKSNKSVLLHS